MARACNSNAKLHTAIGGKCRMNGSTGKTQKSKDNTEMNLRNVGESGVEWIFKAPDRNQWRTFVNMTKKPLVP